eukprot:scaffold207_cov345-Pavlova_lutheri.AAC.24
MIGGGLVLTNRNRGLEEMVAPQDGTLATCHRQGKVFSLGTMLARKDRSSIAPRHWIPRGKSRAIGNSRNVNREESNESQVTEMGESWREAW